MYKPYKSLALRTVAASVLLACSAHASASVTSPAIGRLIWSDEFNGTGLDTSLWTATNGNGCEINLCGFGNAELQWYSPNNVSIQNVPFEPSTRALAIQATRVATNSNPFTSGKIDTRARCRSSTAWWKSA